MIIKHNVNVNALNGVLKGDKVIESKKMLRDLEGIFENEEARREMNQEQIVYKVQMHGMEKEGCEGGLYFGTSFLYPGLVGDEYFMTKGHFHAKIDRAEYYWCITGQGMLILMDESGRCWAEEMSSGSLHYIPGNVAHRLANTGKEVLTVGACWPSDAGHDYKTIADNGFTARLKNIFGKPTLVCK